MPRSKKYDINKPYINYLDKDFLSLKKDLINYTKTYFPNTYKDFNETSPGMMFLEMNAYVGDILSFYIDQQFKEMFLPTVEERQNIINLARTMGYKVKPIVPSIVEMTFSQTVGTTGTVPFVTPSMASASVINKGISLQSDLNGTSFETIDILDFNITGSYTPEPVEIDSSTGVPTKYILKQKVMAVSGKSKIISFNIDSPTPFLRLTVPDKDVNSIISVTDSNSHIWYEVEYLAQDQVYDDVHWTDNTNSSNGPYDDVTDSIVVDTPVPYKLNSMKVVNKRFVVETNSDNTTSLIFGNGLIRNQSGDTTALEEVIQNNVELNSLIQGSLPTSLNPTVDYRSLGESPGNTTLTVKYRVGGGIDTNVPSNSITNILSKSSLLSNYDTTSFNSITAINEKEAAGGADEEPMDSIRENTKSFFAAQNRAVTKDDYEARTKSLPSRFGNIAKVYVTRATTEETDAGFSSTFDMDGSGGVNRQDVANFESLFGGVIDGSAGSLSVSQPMIDKIGDIRDWLNSLETGSVTELLGFKNLNMYVLSYDHNKNLIKTPTMIKQNLRNYLLQFKLLSDDVYITDGRVVNFGVKFIVEARNNVNKSDLKIRCIDSIINYFNVDNMDFQQEIYTADLENLLYNIEGVRVVKEIKLTQNNFELDTSYDIFASSGVPSNNVGGSGTSEYGWAFAFDSIQDGVIRPPHEENPAVFELKNPLDNVKGEVL